MLARALELPSAGALLLSAACLLAGAATARSQQCECRNEVHTVRCAGCVRLPASLPAGVSRLNMSSNRVSRILFPTNVSPALAGLTSLYLRDNVIEYLGPGDLTPLENLMVLDLAANRLVYVDEQFIASNRHLKNLILDGNRELQLGAVHSQSLQLLYVRNCGLTSFDKRLLRHLPNLRVLNLQGNDELPCQELVHDLHQDWPQLKIYCNGTTTARERITTTSSAPEIPNPIEIPIPDFQMVLLLATILLIVLIVLLVVVSVVVRCRLRQARPGTSGQGRLLEEPC